VDFSNGRETSSDSDFYQQLIGMPLVREITELPTLKEFVDPSMGNTQ
jgi:hypothetical protein